MILILYTDGRNSDGSNNKRNRRHNSRKIDRNFLLVQFNSNSSFWLEGTEDQFSCCGSLLLGSASITFILAPHTSCPLRARIASLAASSEENNAYPQRFPFNRYPC